MLDLFREYRLVFGYFPCFRGTLLSLVLQYMYFESTSSCYFPVNASYQYLVPKDGSPLSGLIQDHIVAGVHLTIRGRFFGRADYEQLVIAAIGTMGKSIRFLQPSLLKPQQLWSGKQVRVASQKFV